MGAVQDLFGNKSEPEREPEPGADEAFLDSSRLGRYAEFMVCAELTRLGYRVIHVDAPGFDLIVSIEDRSLRVQVKSTTAIRHPPPPQPGRGRPPRSQPFAEWHCQLHNVPSNGGRRKARTAKNVSSVDADVLALFHHKFGTMFFLGLPPGFAVPRNVRLPLSQVRVGQSEASFKAALVKLGLGG